MGFPITPVDVEKHTIGNVAYQFVASENSWIKIDDDNNVNLSPTWKLVQNGENLEHQKFIEGTGRIKQL